MHVGRPAFNSSGAPSNRYSPGIMGNPHNPKTNRENMQMGFVTQLLSYTQFGGLICNCRLGRGLLHPLVSEYLNGSIEPLRAALIVRDICFRQS